MKNFAQVMATTLAITGLSAAFTGHASAESFAKGWNRLTHQAKVNGSNAVENVGDNLERVGHQTSTNLKNLAETTATNLEHLGQRVERDAKNFIRWIREDECHREGRKNGPEAKQRCEAQNKARQSADKPPGAPYQFFASLEVDCYRRGYPDDLWGSETIRVWSTVSKTDARSEAQQRAQSGNVCAQAFGFAELIDGDWRWLSE